MHKRIHKLLAFLLSAILLLPCGLPAKAADSGARQIVYTALGDSIATGYKLSNNSTSYVSQFGKYLCASTDNMGQVGLDSAGLLAKLNNDSKVIEQVKKSDVISISMGGNDMLGIFYTLKPTSVSSLFDSVKKIQDPAMQKKFSESVDQFGVTWAKIIARIKSLSPNAVIVVTTLINPYQGIQINIPLLFNFDLSSFSDKYVSQIDAIIKKSADGNYLVADSYALFQSHKSEKLTNANISNLDFDPHPNVAGHSLMFQAHQAVKIHFTHNAVSLQGPDAVTISSFSPATDARYDAKPLLTCFTANSASYKITYSVVDAGKTGAEINATSGVLNVKKPGSVKIAATISMPQSNLSAEAVKTIKVTKAARSEPNTLTYLLSAAAALLLILIVVIFIILKRRKTKKRRSE